MTIELFKDAISKIKCDEELAYVIGIRKAEDYILDKICFNIEKSQYKEKLNINYIKRDYTDKNYGIKRLDLGIYLNNNQYPEIMCEAKYYYSSDGYKTIKIASRCWRSTVDVSSSLFFLHRYIYF